ncbi:hypothetical protein Neosp_010202 [[Neocosmospora] mangrovei]
MSVNPNFPLDYIDLNDYEHDATAETKATKALTFLGASALSVLSYEDRSEIADMLQNSNKFELIRRHDVVSYIWPLTNGVKSFGEETSDSQQAPLLAWSNRLQVVLLAFPGTQVAKDVLSDVDVRQIADTESASRFHQGFYQRANEYVPLVTHLVTRFRVVLCGHSLGGAMATIAAYQALVQTNHQSIDNTWGDSAVGLSTITFGAPSPMVVESPTTTARLRSRFRRNFHHIINPDDPVPFLASLSMQTIQSMMNKLREVFEALLPSFKAHSGALALIFRLWSIGDDKFAHFGRLYLLGIEGGSEQSRVPSRETRFHVMDHYNYCIGDIPLNENLVRLSDTGEMQPDTLRQHCLPFSNPIRGGICTIKDEMAVVSVTLDAPLAGYFIPRISFETQIAERDVTGFFCERRIREDAVTIYIMQRGEGRELLEAADNLQEALFIHDSFGYRTRLVVEHLEHASLKDLEMLTTYESIRQVMIIALADQLSNVHMLRVREDAQAEPITLTAKTRRIARIIDDLVRNANPCLVQENRAESLANVEVIWGSRRNEGRGMPGGYDNPRECEEELEELLSLMFNSFDETGKGGKRLRHDPEADNPSLRTVHPELRSLEQALKLFSHNLYHRPPNEAERVQLAIEQTKKLLATMKFCHFVILTQLTAQKDWFFKVKQLNVIGAIASGTTSLVTVYTMLARLTLLSGWVGASVGLGVTAAAQGILYTWEWWKVERQAFQSEYDRILKLTTDALGIPYSPFTCSLEFAIQDKLKEDVAQDSRSRVKRWTNEIKTGLDDLTRGILSVGSPEPTTFWARWMFRVERIAQLRRYINEKTNIGVMGPTEAGKSELLTTLTGTPQHFFGSGFGSRSRTLEIQSYAPQDKTGVFHDCPGFDDQIDEVRQMARLFQDIFDILIIVLKCDSERSLSTERSIKEIADLLKRRRDPRPFRILLSKVDLVDFNDEEPERFTEAIVDFKRSMVERIRAELEENYVIRSRRVIADASNQVIVTDQETLDDVVQLFSTHAQMSYSGKRALCDCEPNMRRKISELKKHQHLYNLAEDNTIWDIVSLRTWLRGFASDIVPGGTTRRFE